jgi:thymidylate synthase (FAD)
MQTTPTKEPIPVLDHGFVAYIDHMGSDNSICQAARISYNRRTAEKTDEDDRKLIRRLVIDKHTSPLEMGKIVFNIKLPIFVMRQFVRHRMQNVNEVSARYTELPDEFYIPEAWRKQSEKNKQGSSDEKFSPTMNEAFIHDVKRHCGNAYHLYRSLIAAGMAREMARMVLPLNIYTEIVCCWDMNNLLKFFALRDDAHAQAEIQEYAKPMKQIAAQLFPHVMLAYQETLTYQAPK